MEIRKRPWYLRLDDWQHDHGGKRTGVGIDALDDPLETGVRARRAALHEGNVMDRINRREMNGMLSRLSRAMRAAGLLVERESIMLNHGSKTNGIAYVIETFVAHRGTRRPLGSFHFGFTTRECYDRMHAMAVALEVTNELR